MKIIYIISFDSTFRSRLIHNQNPFQSQLALWCMFIKRFSIQKLITIIRTEFWELETIADAIEKQKYYHEKKILELKCKIYSRFILADLVLFMLEGSIKEMRLDEETFSINFYCPRWFSEYILMFLLYLNATMMTFTVVFLDILIFTIGTEIELQFRMLNYRLERLFNHKNYEMRRELKSCNQHLTLLIR